MDAAGPGRHPAADGARWSTCPTRSPCCGWPLVPGVRRAAARPTAGHGDAGALLGDACFALAIITDRYDGLIARRTGQVTEFGKLADPIADKALTGTALIGLSILGVLPWWVTVAILVREVGRHPAALLGHPARRHRRQPRRQGSRPSLQALAIGLYILPLTGVLASAALVGHGRGPRAHRRHRDRLRVPGAHPAAHQRAGHGGGRRPPGSRAAGAGGARTDTAA